MNAEKIFQIVDEWMVDIEEIQLSPHCKISSELCSELRSGLILVLSAAFGIPESVNLGE